MINLQKPIRAFKKKVYNIDEAKIDMIGVKVQTKLIDLKDKAIKSFKNFTNS